jgi:FkbM family methyltransferase
MSFPASQKIIFDVGANSGEHTEAYAAPDTLVCAFEPNPLLYPKLVEHFRNRHNVIAVPFAVDLVNGVNQFNVAEVGDLGTGSLYDYHPNLYNTAPGQSEVFRAGFSFKQEVFTIRLDTFMGIWGIEHIDYLHIDAQGSDFRVIQSLGEKIRNVKAGRCECTYKVPLYTQSENWNYYDDCIAYLNLYGFDAEIVTIHTNDTEVDIEFSRR